MITSRKERIEHLRQTGMRIDLGDLTLLVDHYLSHSVQETDAPDLVHQLPIPYQPHELTTAAWVLITHEHMNHCDPITLRSLPHASQQTILVWPFIVCMQLEYWGIPSESILAAPTEELGLAEGLSVQTIPAVHPRVHPDQNNHLHAVSQLSRHDVLDYYLLGGTSAYDQLPTLLRLIGSFDAARLPVSEDSFARRHRGIMVNICIRKKFGLEVELGIQHVVPVHWDIFSVNSERPEEIKTVNKEDGLGLSTDKS
jgi:L-ascorbate 6-phosphate lactonase